MFEDEELRRKYAPIALFLFVLFSFLPIYTFTTSTPFYLLYKGGDTAKHRLTELRQLVLDQSQAFAKVDTDAKEVELYKQQLETLKEKGLQITEELLQSRGQIETYQREVQKLNLAQYEKHGKTKEEVRKLNATYIKAFKELKRRLKVAQDANEKQMQVNELLEAKLEKLRDGNVDEECKARVKELEEELKRQQQRHDATETKGDFVPGGVAVINLNDDVERTPSRYAHVERVHEEEVRRTFKEPPREDVVPSRYSRTSAFLHEEVDHGRDAFNDIPSRYANKVRELPRNTNTFRPNNCEHKAFEYNTDRDSEDYFDEPVTSARSCRAACQQDTQCKAWVYVKAQGRCYLKAIVSDPIPSSCCISGVVC